MIQRIEGPHGMTSRFDWALYSRLCRANGWPPPGVYRNPVPKSPAQRAARLLALRIKGAQARGKVRSLRTSGAP